MHPELNRLQSMLERARQLSQQSAYARRLPAAEAIAAYHCAITALLAHASNYPGDAEAWELLSLAQEGILDYARAIASLSRAMDISGERSRARLKRLARLQEDERYWRSLGLTPLQLASLGDFLSVCQSDWDVPQSLSVTRRWLELQRLDCGEHLARLSMLSGGTDAQVFHNVVHP